MRMAIIGAGVSGLTAATVLKRTGHDVVVFERKSSLGGVWEAAYPEVRLQNTSAEYRLSDVPWPFVPDLHPTREQILRYWQMVVEGQQIAIRFDCTVTALDKEADGWRLTWSTGDKTLCEAFAHVVVAVGHYTQDEAETALAGRESFTGEVLSANHIKDLAVLANKNVAVVGFGKTAVDMATFAARRGARVHHVFRTPRWLVPSHLFGVHISKVLFARMSTVMIPAWDYLGAGQARLHRHMRWLVEAFWRLVMLAVRLECGLHGVALDASARRRIELLLPHEPITFHMRSALAMAPEGYYPAVRAGRIEPVRGQAVRLGPRALELSDGRSLPCDVLVLALGHRPPHFPFLPSPYRAWLEREADGQQLYRHLIHPRIPHLSFAGFNHGFLHIPSVEVSTLWLSALLKGDLELPEVEQMEQAVERMRAWKRAHTLFEPTRSCGVNTRFHHYLDVLLADLGLQSKRKEHRLAEWLSPYGAEDYHGLIDEYERSRASARRPRRPLDVDM